MNSDTQNLHQKTIPRNVCAASAALYLRLARIKTEAAIVALQRAEEGDPTLKYALNATRSEALTVVHHINRLLQTLAL